MDFSEYSKAIAACDRAIEFIDNSWLRMTRALLLSETDLEEAVNGFVEWVKSHPSFSNYSYLFNFSKIVGRKDLALNSIRAAIEQPLILNSIDGNNVYYWGCLMATYAYGQNDTDLAVQVWSKKRFLTPFLVQR